MMSLTVGLSGTKTVTSGSGGGDFTLWTYTVQGGPPPLTPGQGVALAFPVGTDIRDPASFPGVPELTGMFVQREAGASRIFVGRTVGSPGQQTLSLVTPVYVAQPKTEVMLVVRQRSDQPWDAVLFDAPGGGGLALSQHVPGPPAPPVGPSPFPSGLPASYFKGALPYASEMFGVFQPLGGWLGRMGTLRTLPAAIRDQFVETSVEELFGESARDLSRPEWQELAAQLDPEVQVILTPIGLINLFRQYFFEFDTFLGTPVGHIWISPGGTVEVVESSTRRTLVERTAEQSEETSRKIEESLTEQDDVADAVKEDNANDTKLGVSASGGANVGIYHGEASATFNIQTTTKRSSEQTHKHTRTQSSKVTSEIKRNYKTTFKTVTETTDTTSRRYVVQNTSNRLVNYELRRKMRKVGVQIQHIGTRMCWQVFLPNPGRDLGIGDMVHVVPAPDLTSIHKPDKIPYPDPMQVTHHLNIPFLQHHGGDDDTELTYLTSPENINHGINKPDAGEANIVLFRHEFPLPPPPPGFELHKIGPIEFHGAQVKFTIDAPDVLPNPNVAANKFTIRLTFANWGGKRNIPFDAIIIYNPTQAAKDAIDLANAEAKTEYEQAVAQQRHEAYGAAVRDRLRMVSGIRPRSNDDLRSEERQSVYGDLIQQLDLDTDPHVNSELIRQIFDVDEMLYFTAPEYWRPAPIEVHPGQGSVGKYPVPPSPLKTPATASRKDLEGDTVASWYSYTDRNNALDPQLTPTVEWRINYLVTEQTQPAPMGSSLGWLIQIDGDVRRNEFLNAAWVKAVLPIRPGRELDALDWLKKAGVEGQAGLAKDYPWQEGDPEDWRGKSIDYVLRTIAELLRVANTAIANTLATEKVFEHGFDPLDGGFRPAEPYQIFDQWLEVLPTDQVVAAQVEYDPKTGIQL